MRKISSILLIIILFLTMAGCGNKSPVDGVRKEIYDEAVGFVQRVEEKTKVELFNPLDPSTKSEIENYLAFEKRIEKIDLTDEEKDLIKSINVLVDVSTDLEIEYLKNGESRDFFVSSVLYESVFRTLKEYLKI